MCVSSTIMSKAAGKIGPARVMHIYVLFRVSRTPHRSFRGKPWMGFHGISMELPVECFHGITARISFACGTFVSFHELSSCTSCALARFLMGFLTPIIMSRKRWSFVNAFTKERKPTTSINTIRNSFMAKPTMETLSGSVSGTAHTSVSIPMHTPMAVSWQCQGVPRTFMIAHRHQ